MNLHENIREKRWRYIGFPKKKIKAGGQSRSGGGYHYYGSHTVGGEIFSTI